MKTGTSLTDAEVIKALECCANNPNDSVCYESKCPLFGQKCINLLSKNAFDLINRLKAENEELKKLLESRHKAIEFLEGQLIGLPDGVRAEAVREFAERLKETFPKNSHWIKPREKVDNLLKEMGCE